MHQLENSQKLVNRREFLTTVGKLSALISASFFTPTLLAGSQKGDLLTNYKEPSLYLVKSIQANFGSGFRVLSHQLDADKTYAVIEHLENRYSVISSNMRDWKILKSTEI